MSTGFVGFSPKQTLRDFLMAPVQVAALSLSLKEGVGGLREGLLYFPYSTEFQAVCSTLHQCLLPFVTQLPSAVPCRQKLHILSDGSSGRSSFFLPFKDNSLVLLTELSKGKCCIKLPHVDDASAQGSCSSQLWH